MKTLLLDVDDVLFDTPALRSRLDALASERAVPVETLRTPAVLEEIHESEPTFLRECVYGHVHALVARAQRNGYRCVLISSAQSTASDTEATTEQMEFQRLKIAYSGLAELVGADNVRITPGAKDAALEEFAETESIFVDNELKHVRTAQQYGIESIHLVREQMRHATHPERMEQNSERMVTVSDLESLIVLFEREGRFSNDVDTDE